MTIRLLYYKEETSLAKLIHSGTKFIKGELRKLTVTAKLIDRYIVKV